MNTLTRPLTWIAAAALSVASLPAMALQPFKADYLASYMGMQANGSMTLASEGSNKWRYSLQVKYQLADLSQSTVFEEVRGQLRPLSSQDRSALLVKKRNVQANYNWTSNQATWTGDIKPDRAGPIALKAGDMDALLINLAIARDLAAVSAGALALGRVIAGDGQLVGRVAVALCRVRAAERARISPALGLAVRARGTRARRVGTDAAGSEAGRRGALVTTTRS